MSNFGKELTLTQLREIGQLPTPHSSRKNKAVSLDDLTHLNRKRSVKNRDGVNERMKFSVLSARVDSGRQDIEELLVEVAGRSALSETFRIHTSELRPKPARFDGKNGQDSVVGRYQAKSFPNAWSCSIA